MNGKHATGMFSGSFKLQACHSAASIQVRVQQLNMVGIAQLAEHRIVVPGVVGSSPITHPRNSWQGPERPLRLLSPKPQILGCSQVVRHGTLTPAFAGSSPAIPARLLTPRVFEINEYDSLAQLVEQRPFKAKVRGSSPRRVTTKTNFACRAKLVFVIFGGENPGGVRCPPAGGYFGAQPPQSGGS